MPTINDSTVVASAYTTSASARPQRLSNGWIVTCNFNSTDHKIYLQVDKRDGNGFIPLCNVDTGITVGIFSVASTGTKIYLIYTNGISMYYVFFDALIQSNISIIGTNFESTQTNFNGISLAINDLGTELHACWSSKNATYPNSFNIRYSKGTIAVDGSVSWGTVVQCTVYNTTGQDNTNPSITICADTTPRVIYNVVSGVNYYIRQTTLPSVTQQTVYAGTTYAQSSPSAIFVPTSINGLANGRIWCAWSGLDATDTTKYNIRSSYSDDSGVTWSAMVKVTSGNVYHRSSTSITCNKNNEIDVMYMNTDASTFYNISKTKNIGGAWGSATQITTNTTNNAMYPTTIYDATFNFTEPLFIYQNFQTAKVGFYGTWTVTTISVTQGSIGTKSDRSNVLTYAITTDGTMSTITESVNGVSVGTKTLTSGASSIVGLSQVQWDLIKYGKYHFNTPTTFTLSTDWEQGSWNRVLGTIPTVAVGTNTVRLINDFIPINKNTKCTIRVNAGYSVCITEVDGSNVVTQTTSSWLVDGEIYTTSNNAISLYVMIAKIGFTTIVPADIVSANASLEYVAFPNNTLTVTMGTDTFTYTFNKTLATSDDITSAMKAVADTNSTFLPSVKAKLGSAIRSKGGSVNDGDSFDTMVSGVNTLSKLGNKQSASGTVTSVSNYITVSGLTFIPSIILCQNTTYRYNVFTFYNAYDSTTTYTEINSSTPVQRAIDGTSYVNSIGFKLLNTNSNTGFKWYAYE